MYQESSLSPKNSEKDTDDEYSNSSVYKIPYYYKKQLGFKRKEPTEGQTAARLDGTSPKKRGRPRKHPIRVPVASQKQENKVKKKRGRPRKYLKLELHGELPGVMKQM